MPAILDLPQLDDFLESYSGAIQGKKNASLDLRPGSSLEIPGGMSALLWTRQVQKDRTMFNNCYTDSASGVDLDRHIELKYKVFRQQASYGTGFIILNNIAPALGTITYRKGTRIEVYGLTKDSQYISLEYKLSADVVVSTDVNSVILPIQALRPGKGVALNVNQNIRFVDEVEFGFEITHLECSDGTDYESDNDYRNRAREETKNNRIGYINKIIDICKEQKAQIVVVLLSGVYGDDKDYALNYVYVADSGYSTSDELKKDCFIALDEVRVAGCDLQVLGMQIVPIDLTVNVYLYDTPDGSDLTSLNEDITNTVLDTLTDVNNFWIFKLNNLQGAVRNINPGFIQSVLIESSVSEPDAEFPSVLPKYQINILDIKYFKGDTQ